MDDDDALLESVTVLVSAMSSTLDKLDRIAERLADVAAFTEAIYTFQAQEIQARQEVDRGIGK